MALILLAVLFPFLTAGASPAPRAFNDNVVVDLENWFQGLYRESIPRQSLTEAALEPIIGSYVIVNGTGPFNEVASIYIEDAKPWFGLNTTRRRFRIRMYKTLLRNPEGLGMVTTAPSIDIENLGRGLHAQPDPYSDGGLLYGVGEKQVGVFEQSSLKVSENVVELRVLQMHTNFYAQGRFKRAIDGDIRSTMEYTFTLDTSTQSLRIEVRSLEERRGWFNHRKWKSSPPMDQVPVSYSMRFKKFSYKSLDLDRVAQADRQFHKDVARIERANPREIFQFRSCLNLFSKP
ncbi:MAG: hypothetical protein K2Q26_04890 [Bdellovibrionales bacterium]|nr:hypothetical protein [Bdellovibrionales bacterium]